ncbi:thermonuclease family protein [Xanthobacter autotrophicus DSM 431]|uniref:thermonuclease family protein n=1 Tax=Xanthobacter nonsaccharivorans TaxID=3119912 RepID=UPI003727098B
MRAPDLVIAILVIVGCALVAAFLQQREVREGMAVAVDGDTLDMGGTRIRLAGIDAPELRQECTRERRPWPCGLAARSALARLAEQGQVRCAGRQTDPYGRLVAQCSVGDIDLSDFMVREGFALAYRGRDYAGAEAEAQASRRGIWAGTFQKPADFRADHPVLH